MTADPTQQPDAETSAKNLALLISEGCASLGISGAEYDKAIGQFVILLSELARWGARVNLTSILDTRDMVSLHLLDSLAVRPWLRGQTVIDIGTGAGFPGLPLAIVEPGREFVLLDSNRKKIGFVQHMITTLGLANVRAVQSRAEDYASGPTFDTVIARALATITGILDFGGHLVNEKGVVLALKGKYPAEELEDLQNSKHAVLIRSPDEHPNDASSNEQHKMGSSAPRWIATVDEIRVPGLTQHARHLVSLERRAE